jgi:hypothetical protein
VKVNGTEPGLSFSSRCRRACLCRAITLEQKQPKFKLKTQPKRLLGPFSFYTPRYHKACTLRRDVFVFA